MDLVLHPAVCSGSLKRDVLLVLLCPLSPAGLFPGGTRASPPSPVKPMPESMTVDNRMHPAVRSGTLRQDVLLAVLCLLSPGGLFLGSTRGENHPDNEKLCMSGRSGPDNEES
ncbi:unnamed protein product [Nezara viridula]|uniref:Uncharacterized protein n=1 Tax=Nezara viridula TaxID=85310 RepID=A0A9P0HNJ9_NEZVI|nr:unnamed protein product [Nezara viridula]